MDRHNACDWVAMHLPDLAGEAKGRFVDALLRKIERERRDELREATEVAEYVALKRNVAADDVAKALRETLTERET